ncbi:MAG: 50S ribosomal protein L4 [Bacteroidales bacterium]|nr:50S ribosomal protein L4 [Bacteroidales bacterium]
MELKVLNIEGKETGRTVVLNDKIFGIEPNRHVVWLDVKQYLANQRQGTHDSKEKSMLSGSTRKLHKQKGGGGARVGSIKSPLFPGGARVFGPHPRDYHFKLNKKVKRLARMSALSAKAAEQSITVIEKFDIETPKTKQYLQILKNVNLFDKKTLLVLNELDKNVLLSSRNISNAKVVRVCDLNTYDILNAQHLLISEPAASKFDELFSVNE